jgi:RHS repeat-associated protein
MRRSLLRWALCGTVVVAAYAASTFSFAEIDPFAAHPAVAQESVEEATTPTPTPEPTTSEAPTPTPESEPGADDPEPTPSVAEEEERDTDNQTPTPTPTPVPDEELPELTEDRDEVGTTVEETIDADGGRVASPDGRLTVDIPAGATDERLSVQVMALEHRERDPIDTYSHFVAVWDLTATAVDRGNAEVTSFAKPLTVTVRFHSNDLFRRNPETLSYWTRSDAASEWVSVPAVLDWRNLTLTAHVDHFSEHGATADNVINTAPLLDGRNTNLNSGSASLSIPLAAPPGRGGLTPVLNLSYDSGRVAEMRQYTSTGGWAGIGWSLDTGAITVDADGRLRVHAGGIAGELIRDDAEDPPYYNFRLKNDPYIRIIDRLDCAGSAGFFMSPDCEFIMTDRSGVHYVFGGDPAYARWTMKDGCIINCPQWVPVVYQLDLKHIEDPHGNQIRYTYQPWSRPWPGCTPGTWGCQYVYAAYPKTIEYNHVGGDPEAAPLSRIRFESACNHTPTSPNVCMRWDTPRDAPCGYKAPRVLETRRLTDVVMEVHDGGGWQTTRSYRFGYNDTDPARHFTVDGSCRGRAGHHLLLSLEQRDRTDSAALSTMTFEYAAEPHKYESINPIKKKFEFELPHLQEVHNGFGGIVLFDYEEKPASNSPWTRSVVIRETHVPGIGQPDGVREFEYGEGPDFQAYSSPWASYVAPTEDRFNAEYRGFAEATEIDADGNRAEYSFYTMGTYDKTSGEWTNYEHEVLAGHAHQNMIKDGAGGAWQRYETVFGIRPVGAYWGEPQYHYVNFTHPETTLTVLRDGTELRTHYVFDDYGNLELVHDEGIAGTTADDTYTYTPHLWNPGELPDDPWLFAPKYELITDLHPDDPNAVTLSRTNFYYDGASQIEPANPPSVGRLTAVSAKLNATQYSTTFTVYDGDANVLKQSVPVFDVPESYPPGDTLGWIPSGVKASEMEYDEAFNIYPEVTRNPLEHATTFEYDFVLGRPTRVTEPTGHWTEIRYDDFGRTWKAWDKFDSETHPTRQFTYAWGTLPNQTLVEERTVHHSSTVRRFVTCMDGFGRTVETRQSYVGGYMSAARTNYDSRGLPVVDSNPVHAGFGTGCASAYSSLTDSDRTAYEYDPLGNVIKTTYLAENETTGPSVLAEYDGLSTATIDEKGRRVRQVSNPGARTLTVYEDTGNGGSVPWSTYSTTTYRYDRLGNLTRVTDTLNNKTDIEYDLAGRKIAMSDPDMGAWTYSYDAAGNLKTQTDARGITTTLQYDALQRLTSKSYSNGDNAVFFDYDVYPTGHDCLGPEETAVGQLTLARTATFVTMRFPCYDERGREVSSRRAVHGTWTTVKREYDALNQVKKITYPDNEVVEYLLDTGSGNLYGVKSGSLSYATSAHRTPAGLTSSMLLGTGQTTMYDYDHRLRLKEIVTGGVQDLSFEYDDAGNVEAVTDAKSGEVATYGYDDLHRLTGMWVDSVQLASYSYNAIGNLLSKQEGGTSLTLNYLPSGGLYPHPHAVISTGGDVQLQFTYDENGNLCRTDAATLHDCPTQSGPYAYFFDAENRIKERPVSGGSERYTYDSEGVMVRALDTSDSSWSVYVDGIYEQHSDGSITKYYHLHGRPVAVRQVPSGGGSGDLYYLLSDHLGSTSKVLNDTGGVHSEIKYWPYGSIRDGNGTPPTDLLFTGQREEPGDVAGLGLYNYGARFYSTTLGRFLSVDPVVPHVYNPQDWNGYAYVRNNPMRYIDPTGMVPTDHAGNPVWVSCDRACEWERAAKELAAANWATGQMVRTCGPTCQALHALAHHRQNVIGALKYWQQVRRDQFLADVRREHNRRIGEGWLAAAAAYEAAANEAGGGGIVGAIGSVGARALPYARPVPLAVPAAPGIVVGLALAGAFVAPCDTTYCTMQYDDPVIEPGFVPPSSPDTPPAPGFEKRGKAWFNPQTGEALYPDLDNKKHGPHWDYQQRGRGKGKGSRIYPDGSWERKK